MNGQLDYPAIMHHLSLIETHARVARESIACAVEMQNKPPAPQVALPGQPLVDVRAMHAQRVGELFNEYVGTAQRVIQYAASFQAVALPRAEPKAVQPANTNGSHPPRLTIPE